MLLMLAIVGITLCDIRVSPSGDTTVKFTSLYPEYPGLNTIEKKVIELTNKERLKRNLPALSIDSHLFITSRNRSHPFYLRNRWVWFDCPFIFV